MAVVSATSGMPHKHHSSLIFHLTHTTVSTYPHSHVVRKMNRNGVWKSKAVNRGGRILQNSEAPQHERSGDEDRAISYVLSRTHSSMSSSWTLDSRFMTPTSTRIQTCRTQYRAGCHGTRRSIVEGRRLLDWGRRLGHLQSPWTIAFQQLTYSSSEAYQWYATVQQGSNNHSR